MANADFTLQSTEETRAGAMACLEALRAIKSIAGNKDGWWQSEDKAVAVMLHAAGKPSGFMAGFVAVFAEYVKAEFTGCAYNLDVWKKPESAMTDEEKAASRAKFEEGLAEDAKGFKVTKDDKELAYQKASEQARISIGRLHDSAEAFKNGGAKYTAKIIPALLVADGGYSFEKKTAEKIDHSITALSEIIRGGDVVFSPSICEQLRSEIIVEAFGEYRYIWPSEPEMNACIQRFMTESQSLAANDAEAAYA